ncbi:hypothetical protein [Thauera butanivorans]|uniref:hypothetical protein n=1 Tax=Thauera butanivorans TaxID=86174 RepID=UPI000837B085|nr:hypothetical protein [Thauera butanivorans]
MNLAPSVIPSLAQQVYAAAADIERRRAEKALGQSAGDEARELFGRRTTAQRAAHCTWMLDAARAAAPCSVQQMRDHARVCGDDIINPSTAKLIAKGLADRGWIEHTHERKGSNGPHLYTLTPAGHRALATLRRIVGV